MKKNIKGKWYEVLEIIPKKYKEHDLFICQCEYGYKECFQRCDWEGDLKIDGRKLRWAD